MTYIHIPLDFHFTWEMSASVSDDNVQPNLAASKEYLSSLLNKQLIVHATDGRIFMGDFKCTDNVNTALVLLLKS